MGFFRSDNTEADSNDPYPYEQDVTELGDRVANWQLFGDSLGERGQRGDGDLWAD